jgi:hypothetical protein
MRAVSVAMAVNARAETVSRLFVKPGNAELSAMPTAHCRPKVIVCAIVDNERELLHSAFAVIMTARRTLQHRNRNAIDHAAGSRGPDIDRMTQRSRAGDGNQNVDSGSVMTICGA